jgi:hypothetical protein
MKPEDIERIAPGLGRLMPEVGDRTWKAYYAAQAGNWPLARFQAKEVRKLLDLCAFTRPKYDTDLRQFLEKFWKPLEESIAAEDFAAFQAHFRRSVDSGNAYHRKYDKPFIVWKLPDTPPPDLDLTPQKR